MAITRKQEERALSNDERELVTKSHHPEVQNLSDAELAETIKLVRDRRDKAKSVSHQQRREMRGKGAPRGATASRSAEGSQVKVRVLAAAMSRLNSESERRHRMSVRAATGSSQRSAAGGDSQSSNTRREYESMHTADNRKRKNTVLR